MGAKEKGFFGMNWKVISAIAVIFALLVLYLMLSGKNAVSPKLVYFPT